MISYSSMVDERQTSLDAYAVLVDSPQLGVMQLRVLGVLRSAAHPLSHLQIADVLGVHPNNVTGRISELVQEGLIIQDGYVYNDTGRKAKAWSVTK